MSSPRDIWVEGSRAFRAFDDFLLPPEIFAARQRNDELGLAVSSRFDEWRAERVGFLESRLQEIDALASAGKLTEAVITAEGLSIMPIRKDETDESEKSLAGSMARCLIYASPSFSPRSMVGQDLPGVFVICERERLPKIT